MDSLKQSQRPSEELKCRNQSVVVANIKKINLLDYCFRLSFGIELPNLIQKLRKQWKLSNKSIEAIQTGYMHPLTPSAS